VPDITQNIVVTKSEGQECFVCEKPIKKGELCVRATFKIGLVITSKQVHEHAHCACAIVLAKLLYTRVGQIQEAIMKGARQ